MSLATVGSGKTYATLQAWADSVYVSSGVQEAECYSGSDLGGLVITETFTDEWIVDVASGHKHDGTDAGTTGVAYAAGTFNFNLAGIIPVPITVRNLRLHAGIEDFAPGVSVGAHAFENLMFIVDGASYDAVYVIASDGGGGDGECTTTIRNNVCYWKSTSGSTNMFMRLDSMITDVGTATLNVEAYNNTVVVSAGTMVYGIRISNDWITNATIKNNVVLDADTADYFSSGSPSITASHNLSSDATGDDWGATGAVINQTASNVVTNTSINATPKTGSAAINSGTTIGSFSDDIIGTARPQGSAWDMGAFEVLAAFLQSIRKGWIIGGDADGNIIGG